MYLNLEMSLISKRNPSKEKMEIPGGGGVHKRPSGREIPRGWGVKTKEPSVRGGKDISGTTH